MKKFLIGLLALLPLVISAILGIFNKEVGALLVLYFGVGYIIVTLIMLMINIKSL
jgi:hypothetical protein